MNIYLSMLNFSFHHIFLYDLFCYCGCLGHCSCPSVLSKRKDPSTLWSPRPLEHRALTGTCKWPELTAKLLPLMEGLCCGSVSMTRINYR